MVSDPPTSSRSCVRTGSQGREDQSRNEPGGRCHRMRIRSHVPQRVGAREKISHLLRDGSTCQGIAKATGGPVRRCRRPSARRGGAIMNARDKPLKGEAVPRSRRKPSWGICCRLADNVQDFLVEDQPISRVGDHLTGSLAEPTATRFTIPSPCWQVCGL